eukprot:11193207-Lingulodinium_polyedra.AAC.1
MRCAAGASPRGRSRWRTLWCAAERCKHESMATWAWCGGCKGASGWAARPAPFSGALATTLFVDAVGGPTFWT